MSGDHFLRSTIERVGPVGRVPTGPGVRSGGYDLPHVRTSLPLKNPLGSISQHPMTEVHVRLRVTSSSLSPKSIAARIGLEGDECWAVGGFYPRTRMVAKENGWQIETGRVDSDDVEVVLLSLLKRLDGLEGAVARLADTANVCVGVAVYSPEMPALFVGAGVVCRCAALGASLDFDVYLM